MNQARFGMVGGGWRAQFYLRIAAALPERFQVTGVVVRDPAKAEALERRWKVSTYRTIGELASRQDADFLVVCVAAKANAEVLTAAVEYGIPLLAETPPGMSMEELLALHRLTQQGARVQVAEQYIFQPLHAARLAVIRSGKLGTVSQAQVSAAHGYHGVSLIRHFLGIRAETCTIRAATFSSPLVAGPGRDGPPTEERVRPSGQTLAWLDFGDRLGVFDFTNDQYFSWIRSPRILVRGERGEINNETVRYLKDYLTPIEFDLRRMDAGQQGNLEGYYHKGWLAGEEWAYKNPFAPARLSDDEIAVATALQKMAEYAAGGPDFYSLAEASQDRYLDLMIQQAAATAEAVRAESPPWADAV